MMISMNFRFEDNKEDGEERGDMLCDTMMTSAYSLSQEGLASASRDGLGGRLGGQEHLGGRLGVAESLGGHPRHPSHDSLARISSMTNSISPPLHSHGSLSPGESIFIQMSPISQMKPICQLRKVVKANTYVVR